jgi:hypothetical protein
MFGLWSGGDLAAEIRVEQESPLYVPGETVEVAVTLTASKATTARQVRAGLVMLQRYQVVEQRTDSDGDHYNAQRWKTDEQWIASENIVPDGRIAAGAQTHRFRWTLPADALPTYAGAIAQVRWLVRLVVDRKLARDLTKEVEIGVGSSPDAASERLIAPAATGTELAGLTFDLPQQRVAAGDTIGGTLLVEPRQSFDVRGVRVELVRQETTHGGDKRNVRETVLQRADVADKTTFAPGASQSYTFTFTIPEDGCPSYQSAHSSALWMIRAVLDRPFKSDACAHQPVIVTHGRA